MKKIFVVILSGFIFFSCKKDNGLFLNGRFKGAWEFENFFGYPFNNNYLPPGNGKIIVLSPDGSFESRQHDTVLFRGRYFLKKQKDCYDEERKIHFTTNDTINSYDAYIDIESGKLTLSTPTCYADGGKAYYRRID